VDVDRIQPTNDTLKVSLVGCCGHDNDQSDAI